VCIYLLQERYKNDLNIAIQLLQCKPSHFVSQKYDNVSKFQYCNSHYYVTRFIVILIQYIFKKKKCGVNNLRVL